MVQGHHYQALDNLQQLLHDDGDPLVAQEPADRLEVRRPHKVAVGAVDVAVGNVERLEGERHIDSYQVKGHDSPSFPKPHFVPNWCLYALKEDEGNTCFPIHASLLLRGTGDER